MRRKSKLAVLLLIAGIMAPAITYLCVFGTKLSTDHARWAEFGSAIGGIYSPIIALLTLIVLLRQVALQAQMNTHEHDQAYLQQARADIEFYSMQMAQTLNALAMPGKTLRAVLHESFQPSTMEELESENLQGLAANINALFPHVFSVWSAIYPTLLGLEAGGTSMYSMTLASSTQKILALVGFETCVTLDNFHRALSMGRLDVKYQFSPLLVHQTGP